MNGRFGAKTVDKKSYGNGMIIIGKKKNKIVNSRKVWKPRF